MNDKIKGIGNIEQAFSLIHDGIKVLENVLGAGTVLTADDTEQLMRRSGDIRAELRLVGAICAKSDKARDLINQ